MVRTACWLVALSLLAGLSLEAQAPFPAGLDGELYFCPRIDLVPAAEGGPYKVELDGILDEPLWKRAAFHTVNTNLLNAGEKPINLDPPELDWQMIYAAAADQEYIYLAWKITDDSMVVGETSLCNVWQDDSFEVYVDASNNGPNCTGGGGCYEENDAQLTVGADQIGKETPEDLEFGGVTGRPGATGEPSCDFGAPAPSLLIGMVQELQQGDLGNGFGNGKTGWQGEIAIALATQGNNDDGSPAWEIDPSHGTCVGWALQGNDDDYEVDSDEDGVMDQNDPAGSSRDHKFTWAKREVDESAWHNPGVFGKLSFLDPTKVASFGACALPVENPRCRRLADGTVEVTWKNPGTADPAVDTKIFVDDVLKQQVPGDAVKAILPEADVPQDGEDHVIGVKNNSDEAPPTCIIVQAPFAECGGIRFWNVLGAYSQGGGAAPGEEAMRLDYMTDGVTGETEFEWRPDATIQTEYNGASAATGLKSGSTIGTPRRNPGGVPTVFEWRDNDGRIYFRDMYRQDIDNVMAYAQCYVINETGVPMDVYMGISSDDSVQVLLNGEEAWINSVPRPGASVCTPQDVSPNENTQFTDVHTLAPGQNSVIIKVFEGTGEWEFAFRFQDELGNPITEGLDVSLVPTAGPKEDCAKVGDEDGDGKADCDDEDCANEPACQKPKYHRGDADDNGRLELTDAIRILGFLFLGAASPTCMDAADADDNGKVELTDAIRDLGYLFLGAAAPAPPGPPPEVCGPDPTPEDAAGDLGCASYTNC
ncbi:MAG: hypothetical protein HY721_07005 [Planctomycetes bacterium]|nr:hypothetical protein [Planctomycetota bacterium]